jgi:cell division protease FtsH
MSGANDERDQTLNQLLAEMDGFSTQPGAVIVLAATNRPDVLDNALLRPGRFDRKVEVPHPDISSREKILKVHSKGVPLDEDVDLEILSRGTPGFSGADLQNLVNEAALNAARGKKKRVSMQDFEAAQDKIILGTARGSMIRTDEEREKTAYHEAGHTLINVLLPQSDPFHKVTIIPRGRALGVSVSLPARDVYSKCPEELRARIMIAFGGMAAEKLKYNKAETGVASDLEQATRVARTMVEYYGMSDMGPMSFSHKLREQWHFSEAVSAKIDAAAEKILQDTYDEAAAMLKEHSDKLELLAQKLLEKETLFASEVYQLLGIEPREFVSFVDRSHPEEPSEDDSSEDEDGLVAAS